MPDLHPDLQPLSQLAVGERGIIQRVDVTGPVRRRFLDLGLVTGAVVALVQIAPLGDPIALELRGYRLSMRKADAGRIWVQRVTSNE
ncbi:MAG: ferrous iron transport protein A [Caldilineaceae bacterium]|nr:ferrous iron transport protein A [Caldilineaceae bacterium]MBP8106702.1 ferrous iron transport protein A [Caldilineaceae bacterium]MBP8122158.1 ferrous iron transport protein A [Caldilineaceae bacterium]MBP9071753.1 ferrous iron transport protein A [Caldilineaceae bacterium]